MSAHTAPYLIFGLDGSSDVLILFEFPSKRNTPVIILGVPDDVDPATVRPTSEWRLSERTERALAERETVIAKAREDLSALTDRALRVRVAQELEDHLDQMGGRPPASFPTA